jgi:hypothetical protein
LGHELIRKYRSIETEATAAAGPHLRRLEASLRQRGRPGQKLNPSRNAGALSARTPSF